MWLGQTEAWRGREGAWAEATWTETSSKAQNSWIKRQPWRGLTALQQLLFIKVENTNAAAGRGAVIQYVRHLNSYSSLIFHPFYPLCFTPPSFSHPSSCVSISPLFSPRSVSDNPLWTSALFMTGLCLHSSLLLLWTSWPLLSVWKPISLNQQWQL